MRSVDIDTFARLKLARAVFGKLLLSDAQPSRVARSIALSPRRARNGVWSSD